MIATILIIILAGVLIAAVVMGKFTDEEGNAFKDSIKIKVILISIIVLLATCAILFEINLSNWRKIDDLNKKIYTIESNSRIDTIKNQILVIDSQITIVDSNITVIESEHKLTADELTRLESKKKSVTNKIIAPVKSVGTLEQKVTNMYNLLNK